MNQFSHSAPRFQTLASLLRTGVFVCVCVCPLMPRASLRPHYVHMSVCRSSVLKPGTWPRQCQGDLSPHALMLSAPQGLMWLRGAVNVLAAPCWTLASPPVLSSCWWEAPRRHLVLKYWDRSLTSVQIHYNADICRPLTPSLGRIYKPDIQKHSTGKRF